MTDLLLVKSSKKLEEQIQKHNIKPKRSTSENDSFLNDEDYEFLNSLESEFETKTPLGDSNYVQTFDPDKVDDSYLTINDLFLLYKSIEKNGQYVSLHDLVKDSTICTREVKKPERNPELEKRCQQLQREQENRMYKNMTKNVDSVRVRHPEDTIGYQIKQFNKQMIAIFQFIVSVITGFVFGFLGIEMITGEMDFGFRLLLGIMCALTIALAELYFLAKQLNEIT